MSEFERRIQKNREEKMAFLEALKINEAKEDLKLAVLGAKANAKPKRVHVKKVYTQSRQSHRLPKTPLYLSEKAIIRKVWDEAKERENAMRKIPVKRNKERLAPTRQSLRLLKTPLDLSEQAMELSAWNEAEAKERDILLPEVLPFKEASNNVKAFSHFIDDFADLDFKEEKPCRHLDFLSNMIVEDFNIKRVGTSRISALAVHPNPDKIIVCAGNIYGALGLMNAESEMMPYEFTPHQHVVTCVKFHPIRRQQVISCSYDGTVRCGDIEMQVFDELYDVSDGTGCCHFDFFSQDTILVGQRDGRVAVVDSRLERKKHNTTHSCHKFPVRSVSVHPVEKSYFITASNKGMMSLWDLRNMQDELVIDVENEYKRSFTSAFFSPLSGNSILTTSTENSICIFDSSDLSKISLQKSMDRTGGWISQFCATWLPNSDNAFVIGSVEQPRRIQVYNNKIGLIHSLVHENLSTVTSLNVFHPNRPVLAGASASGKVFLFTEKRVS